MSTVGYRWSSVFLLLVACGSRGGAPPESSATAPADPCEGRHEISLTFMYYGEEGESETVALVCEPDHPRAVVDDSSAELDWPRWDAAWKAIESLDELCRPLNNCPPEPDTHLTLRDADGKARLDCPCALDEVSKALLDAAVDAGLQPDQTP